MHLLPLSRQVMCLSASKDCMPGLGQKDLPCRPEFSLNGFSDALRLTALWLLNSPAGSPRRPLPWVTTPFGQGKHVGCGKRVACPIRVCCRHLGMLVARLAKSVQNTVHAKVMGIEAGCRGNTTRYNFVQNKMSLTNCAMPAA